MKFLKAIITIIITTAAAAAIPDISGPWTQAYSDYYVQTTAEIDWKCIDTNINIVNDTSLVIHKHARLHGLLRSNVNTFKNYTIVTTGDNRVFLKNGNTTLHLYFPIPDCIILISMNNLTLFVMTRDYTGFMRNHNEQALGFLQEKNMTGLYKAPVASYTDKC